jgi:three-Cys-motif partner protein
MSPDKADYHEREQAWVKHWLLERYLEKLVFKVGTKWKRFVYVDAFSGPWKSASDDLSDTSFSVALEVLRKCQEKLYENGRDLPIKAIFLEKNKSSAKRLIDYASDKSTDSFEVCAKRADFLDEIDAIAREISDDDFAFVLLDPTGFKEVSPATLAPLLKKRGVEVLINLMWDHINRFWCLPDIEQTLDNIFGSDRDKRSPDAGGLSEQDRCSLYTRRLREFAGNQGGKLWASTFPVLNPRRDRTHYYLVYATHSPTGLLTFDKCAEETWQEQADTRASVQIRERTAEGQGTLFGDAVKDIPFERKIDRDRIRDAWLRLVPAIDSKTVISVATMAELLETCSCLESDLQSVLAELIDCGKIENLSTKRRRPKNVVHWHKNEAIRRNS